MVSFNGPGEELCVWVELVLTFCVGMLGFSIPCMLEIMFTFLSRWSDS
jgi:hypothetical protein